MRLLIVIILFASFQLTAQEPIEPKVDTARDTIKAKLVGYFLVNSNIVCRSPDHAKQLAIYAAASRAGIAKLETLAVKDCHQYSAVFWEAYQEARPVKVAKELTKAEITAMELKAQQAVEAKNALRLKLLNYFKANPKIVCVSPAHAKQVILYAVAGVGSLPLLKDVNRNDLHALDGEPFDAYLEARPVVIIEEPIEK